MLVGLFSNVIVFPPTILMVILFKKGKWFSKRENRVDVTIEHAKKNEQIILPDEGKKRELPEEHQL